MQRIVQYRMSRLTPKLWVLFWLKIALEVIPVLVFLIFELLKEVYYLIAKRKLKDISGKTALVTGAARGLGRELALELAKKGCNVICVDILAKDNEETAEEVKKLGQKSVSYTCDLTKREDVIKLASEVGRIDILINNAGFIYFETILESPPSVVTKLIDVNITSHFWMIQAFLPGMLERKQGHIVAIASCAGLEGLPDALLYSTSKSALVGLMRTLDLELRSKSQQYIKTTCVCPYFINTIDDVKFRIHARIPHLNPNDAARKTITAVLKELPEVTIPDYLSPMLAFNSILPRNIQYMMRDVIYARVLPKDTINNFKEEKKCE